MDSDYSSQELVIIAFLSKDPVWDEALRKGQDLHSVAAEVVYGKKWKEAADKNCAYHYDVWHDGNKAWLTDEDYQQQKPEGKWYKPGLKSKCGCKKHKVMRQACKTINFGLAYGMSAFKLSGTLSISLKEAEQLIEDYFKAFPKIKAMLQYLGNFGVKNGFSRTMAPFFRKRWYAYWESVQQYIVFHLSDIEYNPTLGAIERASKNAPIQGTAADQMKLATVFIRWYIKDHNLRDKVRLVVQVHDQQVTVATDDFKDEWKVKMTELMEEAAAVIIPNGLLKADTNVTSKWSK